MREYKFIIEGIYYKKSRTLPGLNDYLSECRKNPKAGARMKSDYQKIIDYAIRRQLGRIKIDKRIHISYTYYEADGRRDMDNIAGTAHKFIQDSLIECGVISDDGWKNISGFTDKFLVDKNNPRIEVLIIEEV